MRTCWSQAQPAWPRVGLPARSATKPAATIDRCSIIASRAFSRHSPWPAGMDAMAAGSRCSDAFSSSSSTTGACRFSVPPSAATFWKPSMIAMAAHPQSSPAKFPWNTGTASSAIPPSVMRFWIASFTRSPPSTHRRKHAKTPRSRPRS